LAVPSYLTSFVGRDADLRALRRLLKESRLVTLVGPGGAGKTRLAAELVRRDSGRWPDGAWWVDLTRVDESAAVAGAIVTEMSLPGQGTPVDVAKAWLAQKTAVIVLDNCEHVLDGAGAAARTLLGTAAGLTIIATSREPLGVAGEARSNVSGLALSDSSKLFASRARDVAPDFSADDVAIAEVCRGLDQMPLAIELTAAHTDLMTTREILASLGSRVARLPGVDRSAPERQRTIDAAIDWSYRLLSDEGAAFFRRLSVFRGGFDLDAADAVCSYGLSTPAPDLLAEVLRKSMVVREVLDDGTSRYRLLELPLAFAADRLTEANESDQARARHHDYFKEAISALGTPWYGPRPGPAAGTKSGEAWKRREAANLWAAMEWARDHSTDRGLALSLLVVPLHLIEFARARDWMANLVEHAETADPNLGDALGELARLSQRLGDVPAIKQYAQRRIDLCRQVGDDLGLSLGLHYLGVAEFEEGNSDKAAGLYREAAGLQSKLRSDRIAIVTANALGILAAYTGEPDRAVELLANALEQARQIGDDQTVSFVLDSIGTPLLELGRIDEAERCWRESLTISVQRDDRYVQMGGLIGLAQVASARKDDRRALRLAAAARRVSDRWSLRLDREGRKRFDSAVESCRDRLQGANAERAWRDGEAMTEEQSIRYALEAPEPAPVGGGSPLTKRETQVARLVAGGKTNRAIAEALFLSERGAEGHVERIRNKLGVRSRSEVAAWAVAHGLVDLPEKEKGTLADPPSRTRKHRTRT